MNLKIEFHNKNIIICTRSCNRKKKTTKSIWNLANQLKNLCNVFVYDICNKKFVGNSKRERERETFKKEEHGESGRKKTFRCHFSHGCCWCASDISTISICIRAICTRMKPCCNSNVVQLECIHVTWKIVNYVTMKFETRTKCSFIIIKIASLLTLALCL